MKEPNKIIPIEDLANLLVDIKKEKKKIILCHGVFDLLHIGHIRHFKEAKNAADILVVTITPDKFVNKGPDRPAFTEEMRLEFISSLDFVDYVALNKWPTAVETIHLLKPDFYAKGSEYKSLANDLTGKIQDEEQAIRDVGGSIFFTDDIVYSSSQLINKYLPVFSEEVQTYLTHFSKIHTSDDIIDILENAKKLKVLVVGEAIIDEYNYCEPIGMTTKDPIIAVRYLSKEKFAGGILAVANHVANFCDNVSMITMLGEWDTDESFIKQNLKKNIAPTFIYKNQSPTIVKRRFIDQYLRQKLIEVHEINDEELNYEQTQFFIEILEERLPDFDLVIIVDFGHGMLPSDVVKTICKHARFLAVNTQTNSGNRGFNVISKYPQADFICLNHGEIKMESRNRNGNLEEMMESVSKKLDCGKILVTKGRFGNCCYDQEGDYFETPAFAHQVIDRMGAGDAVISITSLCAVQNVPMDVIGFVANAVATQAVATVGHSSSIESVPLYKYISTLLK